MDVAPTRDTPYSELPDRVLPSTLPLAKDIPNVAASDRVLAEAIYRALRMIAAAVRVRYGVVIRVEMGALTEHP